MKEKLKKIRKINIPTSLDVGIIPNINLSILIKTLKSYTTYYIWLKYENILKHYFWKERTFWTDGYFICSIGSVSENQLKAYIENQG